MSTLLGHVVSVLKMPSAMKCELTPNSTREASENCPLNCSLSVVKVSKLLEMSVVGVDGDLGYFHNVQRAFMKQKHRMVWERRHGPVGSGMRTKEENEAE